MTPNQEDGSVEAEDEESAQAWIGGGGENPEYYSDRMGHFRKVRDSLLNMETLYGSSMSPHRTI